MSSVDDLQVLATSIGEFTAETIGREALKGLRVTMDRMGRTGHIEVFLEDNSDAEQKRVLNDLFDIEQMYFDDVALSFSFVDEMPEDVAAAERELIGYYETGDDAAKAGWEHFHGRHAWCQHDENSTS